MEKTQINKTIKEEEKTVWEKAIESKEYTIEVTEMNKPNINLMAKAFLSLAKELYGE